MNEKEYCVRWDVKVSQEKIFELMKTSDDIEGFRLVLQGLSSRDILRIYFPGKIYFHVLDESYAGKTFDDRHYESLNEGLYIVQRNSRLIAWLEKNSKGIIGPGSAVDTNDPNFRHYLIQTNSLCVDIIATGDVILSNLDSDKSFVYGARNTLSP